MTVSVGLLQGFKLELSYGLVARSSLHWLPAADELLTSYCEERLRSVVHGDALWTNRGPRHNLRVASRSGMEDFAEASARLGEEQSALSELAAPLSGRLMPTGMHPWMQASQAQPWPHTRAPQDDAMTALFGPARHGYVNQQPLRLSLPFADDIGFERLFAALRFVMPLIPALAASSPFAEGKRGPAMSCRIASRRDLLSTHAEFADSLIPKPSSCRAEYLSEVVTPLKKSLEQEGLASALHPLALCGNGIVADFAAGLVHIDILDMQECMEANIAVCAGVAALTSFVQSEQFAPLRGLAIWPRSRLGELLELSLLSAEDAVFRDSDFASALGFPEHGACRASELWQFLLEEKLAASDAALEQGRALKRIVREGPLARRMLRELPSSFGDEDLFNLYRKVCDCSDNNELL